MSYIPSKYNPEIETQYFGKLFGKTAYIVNIIGSRNKGWTSTSVFGDCCEYLDTSQANMNTPTTGQTLYIVSTSANDASGNTGVNTVRIVYLDAAGVEQVMTATMNGTTAVSLGAGFSSIQWMESASVGSNGVAVGTISITSTNGAATVATTFEQITPNGNRSLSGRYKIPSNYTGYVLDVAAAAIGNTMDTRLRTDVFANDSTLSPGTFHFISRVFLAAGQTATEDMKYKKLPSNAVVKISAIPGGTPAGNKLDTSFHIICIAN